MAFDSKLENAIVEIENGFEMWKSFEKKEDLERIEYFIARWLRKTNEIRANLKKEPLIMESRHGAHTPGPWVCSSDGWIDTNDGGEIMLYAGCGTHEAYIENPYDRALILAAPELLAALKAVISVADRATDEFDLARAAILKATTPIRKEA